MKSKGPKGIIILVVGNKSDLADEYRKVEKDEIEKYCAAADTQYIEASALDSTNVEESFQMIVNCK